ncbi:MAG: hypothetical protein V7724_16855 [Sediminicola sp.]|tara:strand:+ start:64273 stop:64401 length:129 start_codon:yes stop_codon:yes gene_type:complete
MENNKPERPSKKGMTRPVIILLVVVFVIILITIIYGQMKFSD